MALCEEVVEEHPQAVVPPDFEDRANNDYHHDLKKVDETMKIPGKTDKCCFCDYKCPTPTEQEEKDRETGFGLLEANTSFSLVCVRLFSQNICFLETPFKSKK